MDGTTIGAYRLVQKLGEGGMGAVWLAEHTLLGRRAAIKLLLPMYSTNASVVQRFFNEAKAVGSISDPGIVQVFDFGAHTDGAAYIVMELLDGESLDARLRRMGALQPLDAVRLVRQIAISLSAAHDKGIIHRDIKPENLFVVGDPAVTGGERTKVLDFGIAKLSGDDSAHKTRTGEMLGTPVYMSPEQCRGARKIDHRTDIYSLGAVLFCLVTGRPPFEGEGTGDVLIAHARDQPPVPSSLRPGLPAALDDVILCCLAKDPAQRYPNMRELGAALAQVEAAVYGAPVRPSQPALGPTAPTLAARPNPTTMGSATGEVVPSAARRRTGLAISAAVAVVLVGVGVVASSRGGSHDGAPASRAGEPSRELTAPAAPPTPPATARAASGTTATAAPASAGVAAGTTAEPAPPETTSERAPSKPTADSAPSKPTPSPQTTARTRPADANPAKRRKPRTKEDARDSDPRPPADVPERIDRGD